MQPTLDHYGAVADAIPVWAYARNSLVVAALVLGGAARSYEFRAFS